MFFETFAIVFRAIFNMTLLGRMYSKPVTNRKSFLKRAGLAIAGVFAASSTARLNTRKNQASQSTTATQGTPNSAMARVRKAEGAVARKV